MRLAPNRPFAAIIGMLALLSMGAVPGTARSGERDATLAVPPALIDSGIIDHLRPRFTLKTRVAVEIMGPGAAAELALAEGPPGDRVMARDGVTWHLRQNAPGEGAAKLAEWLLSDIGRRSIEGFTPESGPPFTATFETAAAPAPEAIEGDAALGERLSLQLCGRCHVVSEKNRMDGMGASPSFALLRGLGDWQGRFQSFYALNPHPAFTVVADVTPPFDPARPPPIVPVEMTLDDLDAIMAFVQQVEPADLGAPLQAN